MRKPNPPTQHSRSSASIRVLRFPAIALVVFVAVALAVLPTSSARKTTQNSTGPRTYQPTQIPITRFQPLNFAAAAAVEQLSAASEENELEEVDEPGPKPKFAGNVPINKAAIEAARSAQAPPSSGTGISPGPANTFKAEFLNGTTIPPDTMGAVGTTHIITVTNDRMRIQTRDGLEVSRMTVSSFWNGVTIKGAAVSAFDTKVVFDRFNNRFFLESSGNGTSVNSGALFAVSATADPTGTWYRWSVAADPASTSFPGGSGNWIDYPTVGINKNWIVIDENVFHYTCGATSCANQSYWGQQVYVLDKQAAYNNTLGTINLFASDFGNTCVNSATPESELGCGFTMAPAVTEDNTTDTEYMVEDWDGPAGQLRVSKITGTPSTPAITVGTQFPQSANSWRFDASRIGTANNCGGTCSGGYAPQRQQSANLPSGSRIHTNDSRIQNSVLRNGKLWTVHHVMVSASLQPAGTTIGGSGNPIDNHTAIQWWQIDPTNETAASTPPLQRGRIEDPTANNCHNGTGGTTAVAPCNGTTANQFGTFLAFPSISVNQNDDVLIGFTQMSPLIYPAGAYAMRKSADAANTMRDIVVFRPGQSNYNIGSGSGTSRNDRWGDYSAAQTDPLNDTDFWTVQEYAGTNRNDFLAPSYAGPWETWWAKVKPSDAQPSNSGGLIISEFRLRGPQGVRDEFVELYNPALVPFIVQTTDNSDGWALVYSTNGTTVSQIFAVIPNGTVIPPHGHFLVADNPDNTAGGTAALTYSLNAAAATQVRNADSDTGWSLDLADNGGIALFNTATTANFAVGTRIDSVGFSSIAAGLFKEGNGIPAVTAATPTGQMTFYRDLSSGTPKDTGANENDFIFANTVIGETLGSSPRLGAAGPENLGSPFSLTGATNLPAVVVDSGVGYGSGPNYVRDNTPVTNGAVGTLTVRRTITNNTGLDITRLRYRVVDMTTNPPAGGAADLRVLTSSNTVVSLSGGGTANISGTTLETPPTQSAGGGLNGSIILPGVTFSTPLAAAASTNLQFTLGVQTAGTFNFCLVPESLSASTVSAPLCFSGNTENTAPSITPATLSRNAGDSSSSTIAVVNDSEDGPNSLTVTAINVPTGITVTGISNSAGTVSATVGADCSLATNVYNVTLQVMDSNGATTNGTLVVNVTATPAPPTPTITGDTNGTGTQDQACPEQPLTLHANGATGATSYQWYKDINLLPGETNSTYQATSAGTYYVTATNQCATSTQSAGYVVQNPTPATPFITFRGQASTVTTIAICQGNSQIIDSDSPTGIQWWKDGAPIPGANSQSYTATQAGVYTAQLNALGCHSQFGRNVTITVNPLPPTPTITPGGPTTFCQGGSVTLTSSSASGNQWRLNGNPIGGATNNTYVATASGNYTVVVTDGNSCISSPSAATSVTVNPTPATPTISAPGGTTFCASGTVTLTSSSATGNQWYLNGNPIGGATSQNYAAGAAGNYTVTVTTTGCTSAPSAATAVDANTSPNVVYPAPPSLAFGGSTTVTPTTATDNGTITGYSVLSVVPVLTTVPTVNASGVVSISNAQPAGNHVITIRATDNCGATTDASFTLSVAQASSTTAVSSSLNPSALGQSVTFTATVTSSFGTPTGTVVFKDGGSAISCTNAGGQTLNGSGVATCQTAALTAGPHTITADYSGDTNFNVSTGTLSPNQTVNNRPLISLSASTYAVNEADGFVHVVINRTGDTSVAFNVAYATDDTGASSNCGTLNSTLASSKCDYTTSLGTAQFAAGQTSVTLDIPINQDSFTEGPESFTINLTSPTGTAALVLPSSATITISDSAPPAGTTNAIDDNTVFVRQQYHDFLNREPDPSGLTFWVNGLNACSDPAQRPAGQTQAQCLEVRRILTSSAFFLSIEFMQSGTFVRNAYVATLDRPATNNMPGFTEWLRDTQAVQRGVIVGQGSWQATLDANRTAFLNDFVTRAEFVGLYPTTDTPTQYVDKLYLHAAVSPGSAQERTDAIAEFGSASTASDAGARGRALARILQNVAFRAREINRAFVQVEYFGYLRRNPNDPPDNNFNGYDFWVTKLNAFNGDFFAAEMVKAFLASDEYRKRFGQ